MSFQSAPSVKSRLPAHKIYCGPKARPCGTPDPSVTLKLTVSVIIYLINEILLKRLTVMLNTQCGTV